MAGGKRDIASVYGSPVPALAFWSAIVTMGILLIYSLPKANYNTIVTVIGFVLTMMGGVFIIGVCYFNMTAKKDFGDVDDLV
jgi:L-asparagine transporter-like permease